MFSFDRESDKLHVCGETAATSLSLRLFIAIAGEGETALDLRGITAGDPSSGQRLELSFSDSTGELTARLQFSAHGQYLSVSAQAEIFNQTGYHRQRQFAPRGSLRLVLASIDGLQTILAFGRHKVWWTRPAFVHFPGDLPAQTQAALCELSGGWLYLLPVCGSTCRTDLAGGSEGLTVLISTLEEGHAHLSTPALVLGVDKDPFSLPEGTAQAGMVQRGGGALRRDKRYPHPFEYLGFCSWDAFYDKVSKQGLIEKAQEFREMGLPVRWFMIDDGWSSVEEKRLISFDAQSEKFPLGLGETVRLLKEEYGLSWIGVWQNIAGYWEGISPLGEVFTDCHENLYLTRKGRWLPAPTAGTSFAFWHAWHTRLQNAGIDFIKVDNQSSMGGYFGGERSAAQMAQAVHAGLEGSAALHFGGTVINCMGMASEDVWNRPLTSVSRSSNDFLPKIHDGFGEHALQNAYNSFWHGAFYWSDFDMFWTNHPDSLPHMVLRAVSGGPLYFSDPPGRTDPSRLWPLILSDGRVLRCDGVGLPTADMLTTDPQSVPVPLKMWNTAGGAGVLAAFHAFSGTEAVTGFLSPTDVPSLSGERFLVFNALNRTLQALDAAECLSVTLAPLEAALLVIIPLDSSFAVVGLEEKLLAPLTVGSVCAEEDGCTVRLREGGNLLFFSKRPPAVICVNGQSTQACALSDCPNGYRVGCPTGASPAEVVIRFTC